MSDEPEDISKEADEALAAAAAVCAGESRVSGRKDVTDAIVSIGPDVLWTPKGGGMSPVAYSVIAFADTSTRVSKSVRNNDHYDFQLNSRTTKIKGHKPGTGKGVVIAGYKEFSHVKTASEFAFSEGFATVAHRDPAWINHPEIGPQEPERVMTEVEV